MSLQESQELHRDTESLLSSNDLKKHNNLNPFFRENIDRITEELILAASTDDGWKVQRSRKAKSQNVAIHKKKKSLFGLCKVRGRGIIEASPSQILDVLRGVEHVREYCPLYKEGKILERVDDDNDIIFFRSAASRFLFRDREYVILQSRRVLKDGTHIIASFSIPRNEIDHMHQKTFAMNVPCRRGLILTSGWIIKPIGTHTTKTTGKTFSSVTNLIQIDPKGTSLSTPNVYDLVYLISHRICSFIHQESRCNTSSLEYRSGPIIYPRLSGAASLEYKCYLRSFA